MAINKRVLIGAIIIAVVLAFYGILWLNGFTYQKSTSGQATAFLTVIAPSEIPTQNLTYLSSTPTPTVDPAFGDLHGIAVNVYVKISGTSGSGLNIRENAGTDSQTKFVANESEVFQVVEGPVMKNEIIWWKLVTPYDQSREGWAAATYLELVENE